MKDILEYTFKELEHISTEELETMYQEAKFLESLKNTSQLVQKVQINSLN